MLQGVVSFLLLIAGLYLLAGLVFALLFAFRWVGLGDPAAGKGTWGFRLLIIPGAAALWPLLLRRMRSGRGHPPEPKDSHREAASGGGP